MNDKKKKLFAGLSAAFLTLSAALIVPATADAARGGARISAPRIGGGVSRPAPSAQPRTNTTPRPNQEYRPSKPATGQTNPAAAANRSTPAASAATPWGGMMRNIGLLAGGMMLGGLLSSLFGFGAGGFMADVLGLLMNGLLIYAGIRLVLWLIAKFRNRDAARSPYQSSAARPTAVSHAARDSEAYDSAPIEDIRPPRATGKGGTNYDPRRTADWYRQH